MEMSPAKGSFWLEWLVLLTGSGRRLVEESLGGRRRGAEKLLPQTDCIWAFLGKNKGENGLSEGKLLL